MNAGPLLELSPSDRLAKQVWDAVAAAAGLPVAAHVWIEPMTDAILLHGWVHTAAEEAAVRLAAEAVAGGLPVLTFLALRH